MVAAIAVVTITRFLSFLFLYFLYFPHFLQVSSRNRSRGEGKRERELSGYNWIPIFWEGKRYYLFNWRSRTMGDDSSRETVRRSAWPAWLRPIDRILRRVRNSRTTGRTVRKSTASNEFKSSLRPTATHINYSNLSQTFLFCLGFFLSLNPTIT